MTLPALTLTKLQNLVAQDPALLAKLHGADDACATIAQAAAQKGIAVTEAELAMYFEKNNDQALSDAQLDAVAGGFGIPYDAIAEKRYSILMIRKDSSCGNSSEKPWKAPDFDWSNPLGLK